MATPPEHQPDANFVALAAEGLPHEYAERAAAYLRGLGATACVGETPEAAIEGLRAAETVRPEPEAERRRAISQSDLEAFAETQGYEPLLARRTWRKLQANSPRATPFSLNRLGGDSGQINDRRLHAIIEDVVKNGEINANTCRTIAKLEAPQLGLLIHIDSHLQPEPDLPRAMPEAFLLDVQPTWGIQPKLFADFTKALGIERRVNFDALSTWMGHLLEKVDRTSIMPGEHLANGVIFQTKAIGGKLWLEPLALEATKFVEIMRDFPRFAHETNRGAGPAGEYVLLKLAKSLSRLIEKQGYAPPADSAATLQ